MKTISEVLATKLSLWVDVDGAVSTFPLTQPLKITLVEYKPITIDGFPIMEHHGRWDNDRWIFDTEVPFYQWKHQATDQGWLFYQKDR